MAVSKFSTSSSSFKSTSSDDDDEHRKDDSAQKLDTFILPLAPSSDPDDGSTNDIDPGYERIAQRPFL